MASFDDAVAALYRAPHESFVAERKRLASELKGEGDKVGARRLLERARPPISAWVVNQLWWQAKNDFEQLFETAERLRGGGLAGSGAHREAIAKLRERAAKILSDSGHSASEATLRRVTATLAALAVTGGFDPDPPGALSADRDPPGFEAAGIFGAAGESEPDRHGNKGDRARASEAHVDEAEHADRAPSAKRQKGKSASTQRELQQAKRHEAAEQARKKAEAEAERRELERQRARREADRRKLETALRSAKERLSAREREVERAQQELASAQNRANEARTAVEALTAQLDAL